MLIKLYLPMKQKMTLVHKVLFIKKKRPSKEETSLPEYHLVWLSKEVYWGGCAVLTAH